MRIRLFSMGLGVFGLIAFGPAPAAWAQEPPHAPGVCCVGPGGTLCIPVDDVNETCFQNGRNYVVGGTCSPNSCTSGSGACCLNGACVANYAGAACMADGGTFQGNGSNCGSVNCSPPTGACCFSDGSCQAITQVECGGQGGLFSAGADCNPGPCASGACCHGPVCMISSAYDCLANGFEFHGPDTACDVGACGCACRGDTSGDHSFDGDDVAPFVQCIITSSSAPLCLCGDMDGDSQLTQNDLNQFIGLLLAGQDQSCP